MKIRFADSRPSGDYALVLPVAGKDRGSLASLGAAEKGASAALDRQRFEGEASGVAEHFFDDGASTRRLLVVGTGAGAAPKDVAERIGGTAVGRLLASGEKTVVIDLSGLGYDADAAAHVALGAALRAWRYDRYRTKLKDNQKATLKEVVIVGADAGAAMRYGQRWAPVVEGVSLTRELVTEPANIIYPESFVERIKASIEGLGLEIEVLDRAAFPGGLSGEKRNARRYRGLSQRGATSHMRSPGRGSGSLSTAGIGSLVTRSPANRRLMASAYRSANAGSAL